MKSDAVRGKHQFVKLYEASLNVTIRLRVTEDTDQVVLDNLSFAEVIRASAIATTAESFFIFVKRIADLSKFDMDATGPVAVTTLHKLGIQWKGLSIEKSAAYRILAVAPFTTNSAACSADRMLSQACPCFTADPTKIARVAQVISSEVGKTATSP